MSFLQRLYRRCGVRVEGYMGTFAPTLPFDRWDVAVCTIEKANNMVNKLIQEGAMDELSTIVVDELHMVGDRNRGYLLELLLTKVLTLTKQWVANDRAARIWCFSDQNMTGTDLARVQIIGMTATVSNIDSLARWLQAEHYVTDYRCVLMCCNSLNFIQPCHSHRITVPQRLNTR